MRADSTGQLARTGVVALALIATMTGVTACQSDGGSGSNDGAIQYCEKQVRDQLVSPSSASFTNIQAHGSGNTLSITGDVDADNAFGASLRTSWTCHSDGTVTLHE